MHFVHSCESHQILIEILTLLQVYFQTLHVVFLLTFYSIVSSRAKLASSQEHTFRIVSKLLASEYCYSLPIRLTCYCDVTGKRCLQCSGNSVHFKHCLKWERQLDNTTMKSVLQSTPTLQSPIKTLNGR